MNAFTSGRSSSLSFYIEQQRTGQWSITVILDRFHAWSYCSRTVIDRNQLQFVLVLFIEGESEVSDGVLVASNPLYDCVCIGTERDLAIVSACLRFTVNRFCEVVECSVVCTRRVNFDFLCRPSFANVSPCFTVLFGS